jgi:hypothetical protein
MLRVHRSRLWSGGDHDYPSRASFSELLNAEQWEPVAFESQNQVFLIPADAGWLDIEPANGQKLRAIGKTYRGLLPMYKDSSIFLVQGNDISTFVVDPLTDSVGAVSHFAVENAADDQYFVSRSGVHSLSATERFGDVEDSLVSKDIKDFWNEKVNIEALQSTCYMVNNEPLDRLEILVPIHAEGKDSATPNRVLCLHYGVRPRNHPFGLWSIKKISGRSLGTTRLQSARERVVVGGIDGFLNLQDQSSAVDFPAYGERTIVEKENSWQLDITNANFRAEVDFSAQTIALGPTTLSAGSRPNRFGWGVVMASSGGATIPRGAQIVRVALTVDNTTVLNSRYANLRIQGELSAAPGVYSTYADFRDRSMTTSFVDVSNLQQPAGGQQTIVADIASIIQEIVNLSTWTGTTADKIALHVVDNRSFVSSFTGNSQAFHRINSTAGTHHQISIEHWTPPS